MCLQPGVFTYATSLHLWSWDSLKCSHVHAIHSLPLAVLCIGNGVNVFSHEFHMHCDIANVAGMYGTMCKLGLVIPEWSMG